MKRKTLLLCTCRVCPAPRLQETLSSRYDVHPAAEGDDWYGQLAALQPDLVLVDLERFCPPVRDRIAALMPACGDVPVVLLAEDDSDAHEDEALALGAQDYLRAPCSELLLHRRIARAIAGSEDRQRLQHIARTDSLTGIMNRAHLEQTVCAALSSGGAGLLYLIDLDDFKVVNDTFGHDAGDRLLMEFSRALCGCVRSDAAVARAGGDEFFVFQPGRVRPEDAAAKCHCFAAQTEAVYRRVLGDAALMLSQSASIGIARAPEDGDSFAALYRRSDRAMYRVKQQGKGGFAFYDASLPDVIPSLAAGTGACRDALTSLFPAADAAPGPWRVSLDRFQVFYHYLLRRSQHCAVRTAFLLCRLSADGPLPAEAAPALFRLLNRELWRSDLLMRFGADAFLAALTDGTPDRAPALAAELTQRWKAEGIPAALHCEHVGFPLQPIRHSDAG